MDALESPAGLIDPVFRVSTERRLRLGRDIEAADALRFLNAAVARNPLDLRRQVQRVVFLLDSAEPERLFGALTDLWLALGQSGRGLRSTLLEAAGSHLADDQMAWLTKHLDTPLNSGDVLPVTQGSVLSGGLVGESQLVARERTRGRPGERDPVQAAIELLEHGHLEEARDLLEQALLADPGNTVAEGELLEIYRRSRDEAGFAAMRERLQASGVVLSPAWELL